MANAVVYSSLARNLLDSRLAQAKLPTCTRLRDSVDSPGIFFVSWQWRDGAMLATLLVDYLDHRRLPITRWENAADLHRALYEASPELYLHLLADPRADLSHK